MESHQLTNVPNGEDVIETLTLTCGVNEYGTKFYKNNKNEYHRIHGPAIIHVAKGLKDSLEWWKNDSIYGELHINYNLKTPIKIYYYIYEDTKMTMFNVPKDKFIKFLVDNGFKNIENYLPNG